MLGAQTFQVQKWPTGFTNDEQRRKAQKLAAGDAGRSRRRSATNVRSVDIVGSELWDCGQGRVP